MDPNQNSELDENEYVSKTQLKQQMQSLQQLGEELLKLNDKDRASVPIPEELADAIELALRIRKKSEAYRRQMQYIGKVMRSIDTQPIERALMELKQASEIDNQKFHQLEDLREELISQGDSAINEALQQHPQLDRQKLRQLIRNAKKEQQLNKPPKAFRELFKYLKEQITL